MARCLPGDAPVEQREPTHGPWATAALPGLQSHLCPGLCPENAGEGASTLLGVTNEMEEFCSYCQRFWALGQPWGCAADPAVQSQDLVEVGALSSSAPCKTAE